MLAKVPQLVGSMMGGLVSCRFRSPAHGGLSNLAQHPARVPRELLPQKVRINPPMCSIGDYGNDHSAGVGIGLLSGVPTARHCGTLKRTNP